MNVVNVAVIGCGYWGPNLIRNLIDLPQANLVAVADKREDRLRHISALYPRVQTIADYRHLFNMGLDAVIIATPPATHYTIARDCLQAGLHVLVEKPLTLLSEDAEDLIRIARERDLKLMVGNTFEYNAAVHTLKQLIDSGELGEIYYVNAVRTNLGLFQPNVNAMWDLAPHDISILLYILGKDPTSVRAEGGASIFKHIYDVVYMHLRFGDSLLAHVHVSWLDPCKVRRITVVGSRKMAVYDDVELLEKIRIYDRGVDAPPYTDSYADFQCSYRYGDIVTPHIHFVEPLRAECVHFVESILNDTEPRSNGEVGLRIVRVLESASKSLAQEGAKVEIPQTNGAAETVSPLPDEQQIIA
ncbi:MAG: Gfo/Idh/MocA family oxidoreductase [Chloroflexi bacterium]|nr:Gfo/Idh/MocA family oxidoreductase [Chloroflexota bacterium]